MTRILTRRQTLAALGSGLVGCGYNRAVTPKVALGSASPSNARVEGAGSSNVAPAPTSSQAPGPLLVDIHCHTFNARDIPIDGFIRSLARGYGLPAKADKWLGKATGAFQKLLISQTPVDDEKPTGSAAASGEKADASGEKADAREVLDRLIGKLQKLAFFDHGAAKTILEYVDMAAAATGSRHDMAQRIVDKHQGVSLFTPALVDFDYWIQDAKTGPVLSTETKLDKQIEFHGEIALKAAQGAFGSARFHHYVAFNPRREIAEGPVADGQDGPAMTAVKKAINKHGFIGVKLYPACGFKPIGNANLRQFRAGKMGEQLDAAMRRLFTYCETEQIPILAHASAGNSFHPDASWYGGPWAWRHVLTEFPQLRVCFGHFGGLEGTTEYADPIACVAWNEGFAELMVKHDNVYADISNSDAGQDEQGEREEYQKRFLYWLCHKLSQVDANSGRKLSQRLMYGSDWWMNIRDGMESVFLSNIQTMVNVAMEPACKHLAEGNERTDFKADFFGANAMRYLGIWDDEGNVSETGNGKRLGDFYDTLELERPPWLVARE